MFDFICSKSFLFISSMVLFVVQRFFVRFTYYVIKMSLHNFIVCFTIHVEVFSFFVSNNSLVVLLRVFVVVGVLPCLFCPVS